MKTKHRLFFGFAVFALAFALAGCSNPTGGGIDDGSGGLDSALVAKWYAYPTQVDDPGEDPVFEITASGRLISAANTNGEFNVTTSGGIISATVTLGGQTAEAGTANYTVSGNRLLFSNPIPTNSVFLSFITALQLAETADQFAGLLGVDGYYHKIDPSNPFVGTWTGNGYTLTMTAATWEIDGTPKAKGIYTRDGNTATFTQTLEWSVGNWMPIALMGGQKPTYTVAISGTTVTVNYNSITIPFTKETDAETPTISVQPQGTTYTVGTAATPFSVVVPNVTDGGTLSYQWYRNTMDSTSGGTPITGETQPNYTPPTATVGTTYYYVIVTNTNNSVGGAKDKTATSNIVAITVNSGGGGGGGSSNPFEGTWTADDDGYTVTLTVTASGWELDGMKGTYDRNGNTVTFTATHWFGGNWEAIIPPEIVATATISGNTMTWIDEKGSLLFTKEAIVNAETPTITGQPQSKMYTVGETATSLSVTASVTDGGTLSYRWYRNTTPSTSGGTLMGTQATCTPSTATVGMFYYYVVVTNTNNGVNGATVMTKASNVAAITVAGAAAAPTITGHPQSSATYTVGATASLSVTASVAAGGNLSYQWYSSATPSTSGGTPIGGATGTTYTWQTAIAGTFYYYVIVTNTNNSMTATSNVATITVNSGGGGGSENPFEGTWIGSGVILTVTASGWDVKGIGPFDTRGIYTPTGNTAELIPTHYWDVTIPDWAVIPSELVTLYTVTATVSGDKMTGFYGGTPFELTKNGVPPLPPVPPSIEGTWISINTVTTYSGASYFKIVAADGDFNQFIAPSPDATTWQEVVRGTYTGGESSIKVIITDANTIMFDGNDIWKTWDELGPTYQGLMGGSQTQILPISGDQFTLNGLTFILKKE
jgi:hypothetical protein